MSIRHFTSRIYGLGIAAVWHVPGLEKYPLQDVPDLSIFELHDTSLVSEDRYTQLFYSSSIQFDGQSAWNIRYDPESQWYRYWYYDGTIFLINATGTTIYCHWLPTFSLSYISAYLLGPVMGFILGLHGIVGLHASAVSINDNAAMFVGPPGLGKSTTAAALMLAGCRLLSDDIAAIQDRGDTFHIHPGYPGLRLWDDSSAMLFGRADALPLLAPDWDKRYLTATQCFSYALAPLKTIYLLQHSLVCKTKIATVTPRDALLSLVTNSMVDYPFEKAKRAKEFDIIARVAKNVAVKRLIYDPKRTSAFELAQTVINDQHV